MDRILLFIPMYNCEKQIIRVLEKVKFAENYFSEVIVVNNLSTDNGEEAVKRFLDKNEMKLKIKLLNNNFNYGLGGSHKVAFQYAIDNSFDYVAVLHGDDQGNISDIIPLIKNGDYVKYDCLLGARFLRSSKLAGYSKIRTLGNKVYNVLFSIGTGYKIYDLGSGINMYKVSSLQNKFYFKYKDDLMFNYCMILGSVYYGLKMKFFPITWSEEDQVSNVKMFNQAITVLRLLMAYVVNKRKFVEAEHRNKLVDSYSAQIRYENNL